MPTFLTEADYDKWRRRRLLDRLQRAERLSVVDDGPSDALLAGLAQTAFPSDGPSEALRKATEQDPPSFGRESSGDRVGGPLVHPSAEYVYDNAGVTSTFTGSTVAWPADDQTRNALAIVSITTEAEASDYADGTVQANVAGGGTGTQADPYTIQDAQITITGTEKGIHWNDPDATYYVRFKNCYIATTGTSADGCQLVVSNTATTIIFEDCHFLNKNGHRTDPVFTITSGNLQAINITIDGIRSTGSPGGGIVVMASTGTCTLDNVKLDTVSATSIGGTLFQNTGQCTWDINKFTLAPTTNNPQIFGFNISQVDCGITVKNSLFNDETKCLADTGMGLFWTTPNAGATVYTLPKTLDNCRIYAGNQQIIARTQNGRRSNSNVTLRNCEFFGHRAGYRLVETGDGSGVYKTSNWLIEWCRFTKFDDGFQCDIDDDPSVLQIGETVTGSSSGAAVAEVFDNTQASGTYVGLVGRTANIVANETLTGDISAGVVNVALSPSHLEWEDPGNEIMYLTYTDDFTIRYCWIDEGPEDGYEFSALGANNVVHHCGAGKLGSLDQRTGLKGQLVDFFTTLESGNDTTGNRIYNIWGKCGGQGVIISDIDGVQVDDILVDNSERIFGGMKFDLPSQQCLIALDNQAAGTNDTVLGGLRTPDAQCWGNTGIDVEAPGANNTNTMIEASEPIVPASTTARDVIARFANLTWLEKNAIAAFVDAEVAAGNWALTDEYFVFSLTNSTEMYKGLKGLAVTSDHGTTASTNPGVNGVNFPSGNDSGLIMSLGLSALPLYAQDSAHLSFYYQAITAFPGGTNYAAGASTGSNRVWQRVITDSTVDYRMNQSAASSPPISRGAYTAHKLYTAERTSSSDSALYEDGVAIGTDVATASTGVPTDAMGINCHNDDGTMAGNTGFTGVMSFFSIGQSGIDKTAQTTNVQKLLQRLGVSGA